MRLGVFVSDCQKNDSMLERLNGEGLGIFFVENGVYHAVIHENGRDSGVLQKKGVNYYALASDIQTRGFTTSKIDSRVNVVTYEDVVDFMMNDYEKLIWL